MVHARHRRLIPAFAAAVVLVGTTLTSIVFATTASAATTWTKADCNTVFNAKYDTNAGTDTTDLPGNGTYPHSTTNNATTNNARCQWWATKLGNQLSAASCSSHYAAGSTRNACNTVVAQMNKLSVVLHDADALADGSHSTVCNSLSGSDGTHCRKFRALFKTTPTAPLCNGIFGSGAANYLGHKADCLLIVNHIAGLNLDSATAKLKLQVCAGIVGNKPKVTAVATSADCPTGYTTAAMFIKNHPKVSVSWPTAAHLKDLYDQQTGNSDQPSEDGNCSCDDQQNGDGSQDGTGDGQDNQDGSDNQGGSSDNTSAGSNCTAGGTVMSPIGSRKTVTCGNKAGAKLLKEAGSTEVVSSLTGTSNQFICYKNVDGKIYVWTHGDTDLSKPRHGWGYISAADLKQSNFSATTVPGDMRECLPYTPPTTKPATSTDSSDTSDTSDSTNSQDSADSTDPLSD